MKTRLFRLVIIGFILIVSSCNRQQNIEQLLIDAARTISFPNQVTDHLYFPSSLTYQGFEILLEWETSNEEIINNDGVVNPLSTDIMIQIKATLSYHNKEYLHEFNLIVKANINKFLIAAAEKLSIPFDSSDGVILPTTLIYEAQQIEVTWISDNQTVIDNEGKINRPTFENINVKIQATLHYQTIKHTRNFDVLIYSRQEILTSIANTIYLPKIINQSLPLETIYPYGVIGLWEASVPNVLCDNAVVVNDDIQDISLTLKLLLEEEEFTKVFALKIEPKILSNQTKHNHIERALDFNLLNMQQVELKNGLLTLSNDALEGSYESDIIEVDNLKSLVGSWSAITGPNYTIELLVRIKVADQWSDYLSYGNWGLGRENKGITLTTSDGLAKMSTDELLILNKNYANAVQYKVILRRSSKDVMAPLLTLVALALEIDNYHYLIASNLPTEVIYDVPLLNQNVVPLIGKNICSPTSTTMLLKYKGHNFKIQDDLEHRYIAGLVRDYGHSIYGNWVYNTAVIGSFGEESYVKRMYSLDELKHHLATIGPVSASVKGNMQGFYTTNGHLIVIKGYREVEGKTLFLCNDPNLKDVCVEYTSETILNTWRGIFYVIV